MRFANKVAAVDSSRSTEAAFKSWGRAVSPDQPYGHIPDQAIDSPDAFPLADGSTLAFDQWKTFGDVHVSRYIDAICRAQLEKAFPALFEGHSDENGNRYKSALEDPRIAFSARRDVRHTIADRKIALVMTGGVVNLHYEGVSLPPSKTGYLMGTWVAETVLDHEHPRIFELGVGSGIIMASTLRHLEGMPCTYIGSDIDARCLSICDTSLQCNGFDRGNWRLQKGSGFEVLRGERVDAIVSNPPYFPTSHALSSRSVGPAVALDGGHDGLNFYRLIFKEGPKHLSSGGHILVQASNVNIQEVQSLARNTFGSRATVSVIRAGGRRINQATHTGKAVHVTLK